MRVRLEWSSLGSLPLLSILLRLSEPMPELPEVETMRRGIAGIVGSTIEEIRRPRSQFRPIEISPALSRFRRRIVGRQIAAVGRVGKRVILELDSADRIVIEPRMTGRVLLAEPPDRAHLRLVFDLTGGEARQLFFWDSRGLGVVRLVSPDEFKQLLGPEKLGPDALEVSAEELCRRLGASRRPIKVALMDQRALVGIGNLYASEILHRAGLHPESSCDRLRPADWQELHARIVEVLQEAILHQGSTLSDGMYRTAENASGGFQDHHRVYQRAGKPCLACGQEIVRIVQAQRSTFFCPVCQRAQQSRRT